MSSKPQMVRKSSPAKKNLSLKKNNSANKKNRAKKNPRGPYVISSLNKSPRQRMASPVSAPLVFRRSPAAAERTENTPEQRERAQQRLAKRKHEEKLWNRYLKSRGQAARNALWIHYQPLVRYLAEGAKAKLPESIDIYDLIGSGNIGLQDAITKFDPSLGVRFETYCVARIRGAILDSIRALDWVPRLIRHKSHQLDRVVRELAAELHREPKDEEIAARLNMTSQQFSDLQRELDMKAQILVEGCAQDGQEDRDPMRLEMIENQREEEPTRELQREEIRNLALQGLGGKERTVVEQYYFQGRSMKQIGDDLRLSESRICQIHSEVLALLKRKFRAYAESQEL
jgi:RNA polymerase sigma factor for flagellar operon FliA